MPVVTIDPGDYERFPLKSAPANPNVQGDEDGYIMARPLPYGQKLKRRDRAGKIAMRQEAGNKRAKGGNTVVEMDSFLEHNINTDFAYCIGEHNLLNRDGTPIDFTKPQSYALMDPKVGDEVEKIINEINGDVDEEDAEDFPSVSGDS